MRNLCIEVHLTGIMHDVRRSFGVFNGCDACQVCHRQACLPASKFEKERYDLGVTASHPECSGPAPVPSTLLVPIPRIAIALNPVGISF